MSNIRVNVGAPDEVPVPNTGAYTSISDTTTSGSNTFYIGIGAVIAIALVIILPVILVRKGIFKKPVSGFSLSSKKKLLPRFLALLIITFGMTFSILNVAKNNSNETNALESSPEDILTITTEDVNIDVELYDEPVYVSVPNTVTVNNKVMGGYTLSVYTDSKDLIHSENTDNKISGLSGDTTTTLSDNSWGLSLTAPENQSSNTWRAIPTSADNALTLKTTTGETTDHDETTVYYGVYLSPDAPHGTYTGTINYVAVANIATDGFTVNYHSNGLYFDEEQTVDTNTVVYANACEKQLAYVGNNYQVSHTDNIDDEGNQDGSYEENNYTFHTYTLEGADKVKVDIEYDISAGTVIAIYEGEVNTETSEMPRFYVFFQGDLSKSGNGTYFFDGPTVTLAIAYMNTIENDHNYGYFAKLYPVYDDLRDDAEYTYINGMCEWKAVKGQYIEPLLDENIERNNWSGLLFDAEFSFANEEELLGILNQYSTAEGTDIGAIINGMSLDTNLDWIRTNIPSINYLQDFYGLSDSEREAVFDSMTLHQQYQLIDKRDGKTYYVAKLKDGNVWMTQNLDLDLDTTKTFTPEDTDIPENWTPSNSTYHSDRYIWSDESVINVPEWNGSIGIPESYDPGDIYTTDDPWVHIADSGDPHYHFGNYYNWTAAVAMNDDSAASDTEEIKIIDQSICPAGWTLPRVGSGEDTFHKLFASEYESYDNDDNTRYPSRFNGAKVYLSPTYLAFTGSIDVGWYGDSSFYGVSYETSFWSSITYDPEAYDERFFSTNITDYQAYPAKLDDGKNGYPVRCVVRPITQEVSGIVEITIPTQS